MNKINKNIGILRALQPKLPINALFMMYNTLVYPYLQFCNIAWASHHNVYIESLVKLQKKHYALYVKHHGSLTLHPCFIVCVL